MSWKSGAETAQRGYRFTYDGLSRLKDALYGEGATLAANTNRFNEQITGYDKMGNMLGLKRYGQTSSTAYGLIDDLTLTYNGNQLQAVKDAATNSVYGNGTEFKDGANQVTEYTYNKNGNLIKDLNKNISNIGYNLLNLPNQVTFANGNSVLYEYAADGTKLRTVHKTGATTLTTDYCGNAVYENGVLKMLLNEAGYVSFPDRKVHFYLKDHQGNVRVTADKDGNVEETNAYYPFGGTFTSIASVQPYKYNGKELDTKNGLNWYDYGARHYDAAIGRWHVVDPMAEKYMKISPYIYCLNNPMKFVDPTGMLAGDFLDENGVYIGNDGINDGKLYVIKTKSKLFDDQPTAGISSKIAKATVGFIETNSGSSDAFKSNSIAYDNSVEIVGDATVRQTMVDIVKKDTGSGGTSDANNREYGGVVRGNNVVESPMGPVGNPLQNDGTTYIVHPNVQSDDAVFHSHPSGTKTETSGGVTSSGKWRQSPSPQDINGASRNDYVFARGEKKVYIYNKSGVVATMPQKYFVNPKIKK